jgi:streptomycin 3"-adenylyltransferase
MRTEDDEQLRRVVSVIDQVLGRETLGAYLFGSAVLDGGLRPASDLDVFAVLRRRTSREEKVALVDALLAISGRKTETGRWRRVELTVVAQSEVRPWRYPPTMDFQFGDWLRGEFENGNVEPLRTRANPDLALLITMVMLANRPLLGPPPAVLLDKVPSADLVEATMHGIESLRSDIASDTRNIVLTFARIWSTVVTGAIVSKDAAADWALERLPDRYRPALARARAGYLADEQETWSQPALADAEGYVDYVVSELRRLRREARTA